VARSAWGAKNWLGHEILRMPRWLFGCLHMQYLLHRALRVLVHSINA
jgi:hypothetical protein